MKDPSQFKRQSLCTQISDWLLKYIETLDIKMKDASQFNRKQLNTQISNWVPLYIEKLEIKNGSLSKFKWQYIFTPTSDWVPWYIATLKIKNGNSVQIQTAITFYSDVGLSHVICRDARNRIPKLWANSNDNNFLLRCAIESRNMSRHSELNTEVMSKFNRQ